MITDPCEAIIADALARQKIKYDYAPCAPNGKRLDFYLSKFDLYVEVKRYQSDRTYIQCAGLENVIVIQGLNACKAFKRLLETLSCPA